MTVALSLTEDDILTTLRTFLLDALPTGVEVVRGQVNRVPQVAASDFVVMTPTLRRRIATNTTVWESIELTQAIANPTELTIQCDIHGPAATDNTQIIATLWRDEFACTALAPTVSPLYANDGVQMPFINGEKQYEDRWVLGLVMQVNPVVSTTQQFADTLALELIEVDTTYPPGAS